MKTDDTVVFTDGSSRGNPGPGGFGAIIIQAGHVREIGGHENNTTNNRMEIMAAIESLSLIQRQTKVCLYSDSSYLINGISKWINGWKKNNWKTKTKDDVLNKDLWLRLDDAVKGKDVIWKYIGGHSGVLGNERCDRIATAFADGATVNLYSGPLSGYDLPQVLDVSYDHDKLSIKKDASSRAHAKAYSYISSVGGVIEVHHSWADCERRVKGARGARFRKAISLDDENRIIKEFGTF